MRKATRRKKLPESDWFDGSHCTVREAAEYAHCSVYTIRRWVAEGRLKAERPVARGSSRIRIDVESLQELVG